MFTHLLKRKTIFGFSATIFYQAVSTRPSNTNLMSSSRQKGRVRKWQSKESNPKVRCSSTCSAGWRQEHSLQCPGSWSTASTAVGFQEFGWLCPATLRQICGRGSCAMSSVPCRRNL